MTAKQSEENAYVRIPPFDGSLSESQVVRSYVQSIQRNWNRLCNRGAFVFDIDETLVPVDESFDDHPQLLKILHKLLEAKVPIAFISGSPAEVVKNRALMPLQKLAQASSVSLSRLTFYVNGGSTKIELNTKGEWVRDEPYAILHRIPGDYLIEFREWLQAVVLDRFGMDSTSYQTIVQAWRQKRGEQWSRCPVQFDDQWMDGGKWELHFWADRAMAAVKAKQKQDRISYPFINTRGVAYDEQGNFLGLSGFSASGFYPLKQSLGDPYDLDVRDYILEKFHREKRDLMVRLTLRKAGRSSVDVTKKGSDKIAALRDFIKSNQRDASSVFYYGDEFFEGGNDQPLAENPEFQKEGLCFMSVNKEYQPTHKHVIWLGRSPKATIAFLEAILP